MSEARGPSDITTTTQRVTDPIVEARGVVKTYRSGETQVQALRGTDLVVARGEMVAVVGPSGSGKTTLLNCVSGLDDVDEGQVLVAGRDIHAMSDRQRTAFRGSAMGFIFQAFNLVPVFTAVENVELPLLLGDARPTVFHSRRPGTTALWYSYLPCCYTSPWDLTVGTGQLARIVEREPTPPSAS